MNIHRTLVGLALSLTLASSAWAQAGPIDRWATPFPTQTERHLADAASWVTALTDVALDTKASWDAPDRQRAFVLQGVRLGVTYGTVLAIKHLVHRSRPCAPDCGTDNPAFSFYSAHTALAFQTMGGPRLAFTLPLAISTGGLRIAAGKHWFSDTLVGAAAGALTSRIR